MQTLDLPSSGHYDLPTPASDWLPDWREPALDASLCRAARDETPFFEIIRALRAHLPGCHIRHFTEDKARVLAAIDELVDERLALHSGATYGNSGETARLIYGWWSGRATADGQRYEIVLAPQEYGDGNFVVAGPDEAGVTAFVKEILTIATRETSNSLCFTNGSWTESPQLREIAGKMDWDDIVLAPGLMASIRAAIEGFFQQRDLYRRMGFAWRRGVLLVGPAGTGKTMVCKAAASANPDVRFLYVRDLHTNSPRETVSTIFKRARELAPCILAIEDMDGLVDSKNRTVFLNELDGFRNNDGILVIASSNHPEKIDEALLKRPSRFDRVFHIGLPAVDERAEYVRRLTSKLPCPCDGLDIEAMAKRVAAASEGFTPAYLKEAILSALLSQVQSGVETVGPEFEEGVLAQVRELKTYLKKAGNPAALSETIGSSGGEIGFRSGR